MGSAARPADVGMTGWRRIVLLHELIESALERELVARAQLSVVEWTVLDALRQQDGWHLRMHELARVSALSSSATTRLVARLERRGLLQRVICEDDRRGVYSELTDSGRGLVDRTRPHYAEALRFALETARKDPELTDLAGDLLA